MTRHHATDTIARLIETDATLLTGPRDDADNGVVVLQLLTSPGPAQKRLADRICVAIDPDTLGCGTDILLGLPAGTVVRLALNACPDPTSRRYLARDISCLEIALSRYAQATREHRSRIAR